MARESTGHRLSQPTVGLLKRLESIDTSRYEAIHRAQLSGGTKEMARVIERHRVFGSSTHSLVRKDSAISLHRIPCCRTNARAAASISPAIISKTSKRFSRLSRDGHVADGLGDTQRHLESALGCGGISGLFVELSQHQARAGLPRG